MKRRGSRARNEVNKKDAKSSKGNKDPDRIPTWLKPDKPIWVPFKNKKNFLEGFVPGLAIEIDVKKKMVRVAYTEREGPIEVPVREILQRNAEPVILDDLVDIDPLNDAELLRCLEMRYEKDEIFCFCGPTLIATNPYKEIPKQNDRELDRKFAHYALSGGVSISVPHIHNLAALTFRALMENQEPQAICISGESGAGKTYYTRKCMSFLTSLQDHASPGAVKKATEKVTKIEDKILGCNPIMEAFGNAKTIKNNDSSRFGKYFIMYVNKQTKRIEGAEIKTYLLEKSRVVIQGAKERNYHVFYALLKHLESEELKRLGFKEGDDEIDLSKFSYLNKSGCYEARKAGTGKDIDPGTFESIIKSFDMLKFEADEKDGIMKVLSAILNFGNVDFDESTYQEGESPCSFKSSEYLTRGLQALGLEKKALERAITVKKSKLFETPRSINDCENIRDAMSKELFSRLFSWLIQKLNQTLLPSNPKKYFKIGILDIFGFEDFYINSLEQFCINYTNEKLQNLYISYVFKAEKEIFKEEGLADYITLIDYTDNQPVLDVFDKSKIGIFFLIDSECQSRNEDGKDERIANTIQSQYKNNNIVFFDRIKKEIFGIRHTANEVKYTITGFAEKNMDNFPEELSKLISQGDKLVSCIFRNIVDISKADDNYELPIDDSNAANFREKFVGYKFRKEMGELMTMLGNCECNFVRCIKPNEDQKQDYWRQDLALNQIIYLGILDSINVRRQSLPIRKKFLPFYEYFRDLDSLGRAQGVNFLDKYKDPNTDWRKMSESIIKSLELKDDEKNEVLLGKTRVFMSMHMYDILSGRLEDKQKFKRVAISKICKAFRAYSFAVNWREHRKTTLKVMVLARNLMKTWNSKIEYSRFKKVLSIIIKMQRNFRMMFYKRNLRLQKYSAKIIGSTFRFYKTRNILYNAEKTIGILNRAKNRFKFKAFLIRLRICKRAVSDVFERAWVQIEAKERFRCAETVQRIWRCNEMRISIKGEIERFKILR